MLWGFTTTDLFHDGQRDENQRSRPLSLFTQSTSNLTNRINIVDIIKRLADALSYVCSSSTCLGRIASQARPGCPESTFAEQARAASLDENGEVCLAELELSILPVALTCQYH